MPQDPTPAHEPAIQVIALVALWSRRRHDEALIMGSGMHLLLDYARHDPQRFAWLLQRFAALPAAAEAPWEYEALDSLIDIARGPQSIPRLTHLIDTSSSPVDRLQRRTLDRLRFWRRQRRRGTR